MYAIELYVPRYNNQGQAIALEIWDGLEKYIIAAFEGFTRYAGVGSPAKAMTVYRIVVRGRVLPGFLPAIHEIAKHVKSHWQQKTVLYTVQALEAVEYV